MLDEDDELSVSGAVEATLEPGNTVREPLDGPEGPCLEVCLNGNYKLSVNYHDWDCESAGPEPAYIPEGSRREVQAAAF